MLIFNWKRKSIKSITYYDVKDINFDLNKKKVLILGAGGVVSSIIFALNKMRISEVTITNRTREKAENLKDIFRNLKIVEHYSYFKFLKIKTL